MNIGFIGSGNMAQAIINGILEKQIFSPQQLFVTSFRPESYQKTAEKYNIMTAASNSELVEKSDLIFLAVKPQVCPEVLAEIGPLLAKNGKTLISIAAGLDLDTLQKLTQQTAPLAIIRTMPNLAAAIGKSVTAVCTNSVVTSEQLSSALSCLEAIGSVHQLPENKFHIFSTIAGSSPAFTFYYIDTLARAGVKYGLTKSEATKIAAEAVLGSAQLLLAQSDSPANLIDQVCSPGGTTIEGILALEKSGFAGSILDCVDATVAKNLFLEKQ